MKTRIITGLVAFLIFLPVVIFSHTIVFPIACALCSLIGAYEMATCLGITKKLYFVIPAYLYAFALPFLTYFLLPSTMQYLGLAGGATCALLLVYFVAAVFCNGKEKFATLTQAFIGMVYPTVGFLAIALLRRQEGGELLFMLVFVAAWITDIMAYFSGYLFGKHKLCRNISPKKTIEGSIGGTLFCGLAFVLYGLIVHKLTDRTPSYLALAIAGILLSVISQIGDLVASLIKREYEVKDYGNLFPGHGGILDRFDSVLAVAPILLLLANLTQFFSFFA